MTRRNASKRIRRLLLEPLEYRLVMSTLPPAGDLTEGNAAQWQTFASDNAATSVSNDTTHVREGAESLKFDTQSGGDTGIRLPSGADTWDLSTYTVVDLWAYGDNNTPYTWQGNFPVVTLTSAAGSRQIVPNKQMMSNHAWGSIHVPLAGDSVWQVADQGTFDVGNVTSVEIHLDTWDYGFSVYFDGVHLDTRGPNDLPPAGPEPPPGVNPDAITSKVLLYAFDPIMENRDGRRAHASFGWEDPVDLTNRIVQEFQTLSHGLANFQLVDTVVADEHPYFDDGFQYTDETYTAAVYDPAQRHNTGHFDYIKFINDHNLVQRVDSGEIDEVWVYTAPWDGNMWESAMAGQGAYWINGPTQNVPSQRAFPIMGFNYEAGFANALHSFGHRVENTMTHLYGPTGSDVNGTWVPNRDTNWSKFVYLNKDNPGSGLGGVGNVHFPVNGVSDYDYADANPVLSLADNWYDYPDVDSGAPRQVSRTDWQRADGDWHRGYMDWWYDHFPRYSGRGTDNYLNNWWRYIADINQYKSQPASLYFTRGIPQVTMIAPPSGDGVVPIQADAFVDGALGRVDLYVDGSFYATDSLAPFTFNLNANALSAGGHTLVAKAYELQNGTEGVAAPRVFYKGLGASPPIISPLSNSSYTENGAPILLAAAGVVSDPDSADFKTGKLTVAKTANNSFYDVLAIANQGSGAGQIGVSGSTVKYQNATIGSFTGGAGGLPLVVTFTTTAATPQATQALLRAITFSNPLENPYVPTRTVRFTLIDGDGGTSAPADLSVNVVAVNDAPTIAAPGAQATTTNAPLVFSNANGNSLTVADVDAGTSQVQLAVAAINGEVTLVTTTGLTFTSGANGQASFTVKGTLAALTAALDGLSFGPASGFVGDAGLQLTLNDLGNSGTGGAKSAVKSIAITVQQVIDNGTPGYAETGGAWYDSGLRGYNNSSTRYSPSTNAKAEWTPMLSPGFYTIAIFKLANNTSSSNAQLSVVHDGLIDTQSVDLRASTAGFVELPGVFSFRGAGGELVRLLQGTAGGYLRADAIRFTKVPAPVVLIDNGGAGYAETGAWSNSGLTGYNGSSTRYNSATNATAEWTPSVTAGYYRVEFYKVVHAASQTSAKLSVIHNGVTDTQTINLTSGSAGFVDLGTFYFAGSGSERLRLWQTTAGTLRADAVRFTKVAHP
jgi:hypothetical protein